MLKQVMSAGVEANIGCIPSRVTIFFCDIQGFKDICKGKDPTEVLELSWPKSRSDLCNSEGWRVCSKW